MVGGGGNYRSGGNYGNYGNGGRGGNYGSSGSCGRGEKGKTLSEFGDFDKVYYFFN